MNERCWEYDGPTRFDGRAELYAKGRPSYADAAIDFIVERTGPRTSRVADLGAGTGISTRLLARRFPAVVAVEPNLEMALAAGGDGPAFVLGRSEVLPFGDGALDLVTAFNSFHWFVPDKAMPEIVRVVRPEGVVAVVWNTWDLSDEFSASFVALLRSAAGDFPPEDLDAEIAPLYQCGRFGTIERRDFSYRHRIDREGLTTRLQSVSYVPRSGPAADALMSELAALYVRFADASGFVEHRYTTCVFVAAR